MPLFEYNCINCKKEFEILVLDQKEIIKCMFCESENVEKQYSAFGVSNKNTSNISDSSQSMVSCSHKGCGCGN